MTTAPTRPIPTPAPGPDGPAASNAPLTQVPQVDPRAAAMISADQAVRVGAVPYAFDGATLLVAMNDADDLEAADQVSILAGAPVRRVAVERSVFGELLREAFGATAAQMAQRLGGAAG